MKSIVETIYDAQRGAYEIPRISDTHEPITLKEAYDCQAQLIARYVAEGRKIIGYKMGLTTHAKMEQMHVSEPAHGVLFEDMLLRDNHLRFEELIHPKAEPEIAVRFGSDLPPGITSDSIADYISEIAPAIEIVDSRYERFSFSISDVIVDNVSAAQFAIGEWKPYSRSIALDSLRVHLLVNNLEVAKGVSFAVLGNPLNAVYDLQRGLSAQGDNLKAGDIVLTGGITPAYDIHPGDTVLHRNEQLGDLLLQ